MKKYGIVILAAGGSKRLGSPKQLLSYKNNSLLKHIVSIALSLNDALAIVVVGAEKEAMQHEVLSTGIQVIVNESWEQGMSSSIKRGLEEMTKINPRVEACIFTVCDQPFITLQLFETLIATHEQTLKGIVAAAYAGTTGTPVLIQKKYFHELMNLQKEEGAKKIVQKNTDDLATVPFSEGDIDIDTKEDYKKLIDADR